MADHKGVVLEVKGRTMIVMTDDGDFIRLPCTGTARPGAVVPLPVKRRRPWPAALAAVAALLLCLSAVLYGPAVLRPAAAYVDLELGGSLSLTLDRDGHLRRVEALDEAGKAVLRASNLGSRPSLDRAVARLVEGAVAAGALKPGDPALVIATLAPAAGDSPPVEVTDIRAWITASLTGKDLNGQVVVLPATSSQYRDAHQQGLSTGRWLVAQQGRRQGADLTRADLEKASLQAVLDRHRLKVEDLFPGACSTVQDHKPATPPGWNGKDAARQNPAGKGAGKSHGSSGDNDQGSGGLGSKAGGKGADSRGTEENRKNRDPASTNGTPPGQARRGGELGASPPAADKGRGPAPTPDNAGEDKGGSSHDNARKEKGSPSAGNQGKNGKGLHN